MESAFENNYERFEVILVDNSSSDNSVEIASRFQERRQKLTIVRNSCNLGFANGNNIGIKLAGGKYIAFLNSDTEVDPYWLTALVKVMEGDSTIGAAQSKLLLFDRKTYDSAGDFIDPVGFGFRRGGDWGETDKGQYDEIQEIFSARGASMITRQSVLGVAGNFDTNFFLNLEDIDLCWRIRLHGFKILFVPESVVYHKGSGTIASTSGQTHMLYHTIKNSLIMMIKNYELKNTVKYVIPRIIIFCLRSPVDTISALKFVLTNFKRISAARAEIQAFRKIRDTEVMKFMLVSSYRSLLIYLVRVFQLRFLQQEQDKERLIVREYFDKNYPHDLSARARS